MGQVERDTRFRMGSNHERPRSGLKAHVRSVEVVVAIPELGFGSFARKLWQDNGVEITSRSAGERKRSEPGRT